MSLKNFITHIQREADNDSQDLDAAVVSRVVSLTLAELARIPAGSAGEIMAKAKENRDKKRTK